MSIENFYFHCGTEWSDPYCDSLHNDRCPVCNGEIEPYKSQGFSDPQPVHHPLSNDLAFDFASALIVATKNVIDKVTNIRGIDMELYVGHQLMEAKAASARTSHALSDGDQDHPFQSVLKTGDELEEHLGFLIDDMRSITGIEIDDYAPTEMNKADIALNNWAIYKSILAERLQEERSLAR